MMKANKRTRTTAKLSALVLTVSAILVGTTAPAFAAESCEASASWGYVGSGSYTESWPEDCYRTQSRVYRYTSSYPVAYDGPMSTNRSYVEAYGGTAAGWAYRIQDSNGSTWTGWLSLG